LDSGSANNLDCGRAWRRWSAVHCARRLRFLELERLLVRMEVWHQKVQKLEAALAKVEKRLKEQDAKIERGNDKVELSKAVPQTVLNNQ